MAMFFGYCGSKENTPDNGRDSETKETEFFTYEESVDT